MIRSIQTSRPARRRAVAAGVTMVLALAIAGATIGTVGATSAGKPASGEPIKVGYIEQFLGAAAQPTSPQALQAYIDDWNQRGGHHGQPIELVSEDGGFDSGQNNAAVQKLANEDEVVMFASIGLCEATLGTITSMQIPTLPTFNEDCQGGPISPCLGKFAVDEGTKGVAWVAPGGIPGFDQVRDDLGAYLAGQDITYVEKDTPLLPTAADYDAVIADLKSAGVDTVWLLSQPESAVLGIESATRQGFGPSDGIRFIFANNVYNEEAKAVPEFEGTYVQLLTNAWEADDKEIKKARKVVDGKVDALDGFAAAGYQTGARVEQIFDHVKGEVTRESITKAIQTMGPQRLPLTPLKVDPSVDPTTNASGCTFVVLENGEYQPASDFLVVKSKEFR